MRKRLSVLSIAIVLMVIIAGGAFAQSRTNQQGSASYRSSEVTSRNECSTCDGDGYIEKVVTARDGTKQTQKIKCSSCDGDGKR
jgi:DnaJ-class molecular chaperone